MSTFPPAEGGADLPDEEMVPHAFNSRTPYEPGDDRDIWCKDCEYHRDHEIHKIEVGGADLHAQLSKEKEDDCVEYSHG